MNLNQLLEQREVEILNQATDALARAHLTHYDEAGREQNKAQLQTLYDLMVRCIKDRDLTAMVNYVENLAQKQFTAGFDLHEVQLAFNVLEEVIWKQIIQECSPSQLPEALGLISTVHGAGKDALARQYVSLASKTKPASLNLMTLFKGTDGL
jgi:hypothetical protein